MREILFRGKRISDGRWIEGSLWIYIGVPEIISGGGNSVGYHVIPETVGQYTGLTDKNGKKIFEGDIVRHHTTPMLVKFDEKSASFLVGYTMDGSYYENTLHGHGYLEVIGTIHDNPELMEVEHG